MVTLYVLDIFSKWLYNLDFVTTEQHFSRFGIVLKMRKCNININAVLFLIYSFEIIRNLQTESRIQGLCCTEVPRYSHFPHIFFTCKQFKHKHYYIGALKL